MKVAAATQHRFANRMMVTCTMLICMVLLCTRAAQPETISPTGRVSDVQGSLAVQGEAEDEISYAERNTVLREHDTLWTSEKSYAEIELEKDSWLRLASDTKIEVRQLPPRGELRLWAGSIYLQIASLSKWPIRLKTPAGEVEVYPASVVRVDLMRGLTGDDEYVRVSLQSGRVQVFPDTGPSLRLRERERVDLKVDQPAAGPLVFEESETDGFAKYNSQRVQYYAARPLPQGLGEDVVGARDLHGYGSWVTLQTIRYWRPRCAPGWRPYSSGYWSYVPGCGYTWVDYAPWGYTTCHYGRWLYRPGYGWLWRPGYRWAPSHVAWSSVSGYYGWAPLDPWGRPCHYGRGSFRSSKVVIDFRSWTFCLSDRFYYGRHHRRYTQRKRSLYAGGELPEFRNPSRVQRGFRVVRDVHREIGVPRERVRGIMLSGNGVPARERARQTEYKVPEHRLKRIQTRFQTPVGLDRLRARHPGEAERLQKNPVLKVEPTRIVRGNEALHNLTQQRARQQRVNTQGKETSGEDAQGRIGEHRDALPRQNGGSRVNRDNQFLRPRPALERPVSESHPSIVGGTAITGGSARDEVKMPHQDLNRQIGSQRRPHPLDPRPKAPLLDGVDKANENHQPRASHGSTKAVNDSAVRDNGAKSDENPKGFPHESSAKPNSDNENPPASIKKEDKEESSHREAIRQERASREAARRANQRRPEPQPTEPQHSERVQPYIQRQESERRAVREQKQEAQRQQEAKRQQEETQRQQEAQQKQEAHRQQEALRQQEAQQKQEAQRHEAERREAERSEARRREAERSAAQQREENQRREEVRQREEAQQREDARRREVEEREARRREAQQRRTEQRDSAAGRRNRNKEAADH